MESDFTVVARKDRVQNFVLTRHAMERCAERGFQYRDVQRGLVKTSIVNYDGFEPIVITVLPRGSKMRSVRAEHRRRAKGREKARRANDAWVRFARLLSHNAMSYVPISWEERISY